MEHWIIYDPVTGAETGRGFGPVGAGDRQRPGGGRCAVAVPRTVIQHGTESAPEALREALALRIARDMAASRSGTPLARLRRALALEERINAAADAADLLKIDITQD